MQKDCLSLGERVTYFGGSVILLCVFFFSLFLFWQSGFLFSSWLSSIGYILLALLLGTFANGTWLLFCLFIAFFNQLFDRIFGFSFPDNKRSR